MNQAERYLELSARERILHWVDKGSFTEWLPPKARVMSPNLAALDLPPSFDDGVVIGKALLKGQPIYIAAQEYSFMGGGVGEVHGAKLAGLCLKAIQTKPQAVIFLLDSGGVRLHEANAGEIAISEIIEAVIGLKAVGVPTIGVVAGKNGAFGGISIISGCLDYLFISEGGRTGVSGPEVIETVMGTEEYDASDRALVWRTCGGRHRSLMGDTDYTEDSIEAIRDKVIPLLNKAPAFNLDALIQEQDVLAKRATQFAQAKDGREIWHALGVKDPEHIPDLSEADFIAQCAAVRSAR